MTVISKSFKTIKQAERYQNKLYDQYWSVKLIDWPKDHETGWYKWLVATKQELKNELYNTKKARS